MTSEELQVALQGAEIRKLRKQIKRLEKEKQELSELKDSYRIAYGLYVGGLYGSPGAEADLVLKSIDDEVEKMFRSRGKKQ